MSFILHPFTLATDGVLAPSDSGALCLQPFALASGGQFALEAAEALGLADPWSGPSRFTEPFDRGYYLWKYGKPKKRIDFSETGELPEIVQEPERSNIMPELLRLEAKGQLLTSVGETRAKLLELEEQNRIAERDIAELELYIREIKHGLETGLAAKLAAQELETERQVALIATLEQNVADALEALVAAMRIRRRMQNEQAAIEAVMRIYY